MAYLAEEVFRRKAAVESNREISERFGLTKRQVYALYSALIVIRCCLSQDFPLHHLHEFFFVELIISHIIQKYNQPPESCYVFHFSNCSKNLTSFGNK